VTCGRELIALAVFNSPLRMHRRVGVVVFSALATILVSSLSTVGSFATPQGVILTPPFSGIVFKNSSSVSLSKGCAGGGFFTTPRFSFTGRGFIGMNSSASGCQNGTAPSEYVWKDNYSAGIVFTSPSGQHVVKMNLTINYSARLALGAVSCAKGPNSRQFYCTDGAWWSMSALGNVTHFSRNAHARFVNYSSNAKWSAPGGSLWHNVSCTSSGCVSGGSILAAWLNSSQTVTWTLSTVFNSTHRYVANLNLLIGLGTKLGHPLAGGSATGGSALVELGVLVTVNSISIV
jgi:hypothetical protein